MVISNMSLFLKYLFCIDAIALDYRVNLLVWYLLHWQRSQNLMVSCGSNGRRQVAVIVELSRGIPRGISGKGRSLRDPKRFGCLKFCHASRDTRDLQITFVQIRQFRPRTNATTPLSNGLFQLSPTRHDTGANRREIKAHCAHRVCSRVCPRAEWWS